GAFVNEACSDDPTVQAEVESLLAHHERAAKDRFLEESKQRRGEKADATMGADGSSAEAIQQIGRYRVERVLGEGAFGRVFLAHDDELNRPVAIKVPHRDRISRPEAVKLYLAEARLLASLDHPNIVPVYDFGRTENGLCFIVSKFIAGSTLSWRIENDR